jgi:Asp-tRNA(Asn)/Glu-tRNA(Gln) amidotransferase A subunit family amidase
MDDVCCLDMVELARRIANRELSSTELTRAQLSRCRQAWPACTGRRTN